MTTLKIILAFLLLSSACFAASTNTAIALNGVTKYVTVNNSGANSLFDFTTDTFALEAWIKPLSFVGGSNSFEHTIIGKDSTPNNGSGFVLRTGGSKKLNFAYNYGGAWVNVTTTSAVLYTNQWHHVAVTKIGGNITLYCNGQIVASTIIATNINIASCPSPLRIGENGNLANRKFNGVIDEVKIWKSARTLLNIQEDMIATCSPYPTSLLAYYKMEDTGTIAPFIVQCATDTNYNGVHSGVRLPANGPLMYKGNITTIYVDSSNTNTACNAQTGESWASALSDLNDAIYISHTNPNVEKILVAKGTYIPSQAPFKLQTNRVGLMMNDTVAANKTFHIRTGLQIFGGFPSGGGVQNWVANPTILNGAGVGGSSVNKACHVLLTDSIVGWGVANDTTIIDGFTVTNGFANNLILIFGNYDYDQASGGGLYTIGGINVVNHCNFTNCYSLGFGGAIFSNYSPQSASYRYITNCKFSNISTANTSSGSAISMTTHYGIISNDTFTNNNNSHGVVGLEVLLYGVLENNYFTQNNTYGTLHIGGPFKVINNQFLHNTGTAISTAYSNDDSVMNNIIIGHKSADYGGGLYIYGGANHYVTENTFMNDSANNGGGGLYYFNTNCIFKNNIFKKCYATIDGGAVYAHGGSLANYYFKNTLDSNVCGHIGGAMFIAGGTDTIVNNYFTNNVSNFWAGGLFLECKFYFTNNVIANNTANTAGGAEFNSLLGYIGNNTFVNNKATLYNVNGMHTGGLFFDYGTYQINNNIIWNNSSPNNVTDSLGSDFYNYSSYLTFKNNIMQLPDSFYTTLGTGNYDIGTAASNNIFATAPSFVNSFLPAGADNIFFTNDDGARLLTTSVGVDAGDSSLISNFSSTDILQHDRILDNNIDIGAFEISCMPTGNIVYTNTLICPGSSVQLFVNATANAIDMQWFADSSSTAVLDTGFTFTTPILSATDTFWVKNNNCFNTAKVPIVVQVQGASPYVINTTPASNLQICSGTNTTLQASSNMPNDSIFWYASVSATNPIGTGNLLVTDTLYTTDTFWVSAHSCTTSPKIPIIVTVFISTNSNTTLHTCSGYVWAINNQFYNTSGIYTNATINSNGCMQYDTLDLHIHSATYSATILTACNSYYWPITNTTYTASGVYKDTLVNANGCDSILTLNLTLNTLNATITQSGLQLNALPAGASYQWYNCNTAQILNGANSATYMVANNGNYAAIVSQNGCTDTSNCITITGVAIQENNDLQSTFIYPNPTSGKVAILHHEAIEQITITNNLGQKIIEVHTTNSNNETVNIQHLIPGIYTLCVQSKNDKRLFKVIKQ